MKRWLTLLFLLAVPLAAQTAVQKLSELADELDAAMKAGDWTRAAKASGELRESAERARNDGFASANRELTDKILTWLPVDSQTLVVAQRPFAVPARGASREPPSALGAAQSFLLGPLVVAEQGKLATGLTGRVIQLAARTGRAFGKEPDRQPGPDRGGELGQIPYEGCGVYAFVDPLPDPMLAREPEESILGYRVWTSRGSEGVGQNTYFSTVVKSGTLLICNDRDFFRELLTRMGASSGGRALPDGLAEWTQVDRTAPVWGLSHYGSGLPFWRGVLPEFSGTPPAGVTIAFGTATAQARMLIVEDPWTRVGNTAELKGAVKSRPVGEGVWEVTLDSTKETGSLVAALVLMGLMGFVVLI